MSFGLVAAVAALMSLAAPLGAVERGQSCSHILLVQGPAAGAVVREALTRIRAELEAAQLEVEIVVLDASGVDVEQDLVALAGREGAAGVLALSERPPREGGAAVDVWALDVQSGRTVSQTISTAAGSHPAAVLAVRGLEVLRAGLLDLFLPSPDPTRASTKPRVETVRAWVATSLPVRSRGVFDGLAVGAFMVVLHDFGAGSGAVGPAVLPAVFVSLSRSPLAVRVTAAGGGTSAHVSASTGEARVRQKFATLEGLLVGGAGRVRGFLAAGIGAHEFSVRGQPKDVSAFQGRDTSAWSGTVLFGGGLSVPLGSRAAVQLECRGVQAFSAPTIEIGGISAGRVGRALALLQLGLLATF